jgi:hypothetical protein
MSLLDMIRAAHPRNPQRVANDPRFVAEQEQMQCERGLGATRWYPGAVPQAMPRRASCSQWHPRRRHPDGEAMPGDY